MVALDLSIIDWNAVSAMVSFVMVICTSISLWQSKKQLKEMRRQWEEEQRPYLVISFVTASYSYGRYDIEFRNIGKTSAEDITFQFDSNFLGLFEDQLRLYFSGIGINAFKILPGETKRIRIIENAYLSERLYHVGNKRVDVDYYNKILDYLKTTGVTVTVSHNKVYNVCENITLVENRNQTITMIDALIDVGMQVSLLRLDIRDTLKPKKE